MRSSCRKGQGQRRAGGGGGEQAAAAANKQQAAGQQLEVPAATTFDQLAWMLMAASAATQACQAARPRPTLPALLTAQPAAAGRRRGGVDRGAPGRGARDGHQVCGRQLLVLRLRVQHRGRQDAVCQDGAGAGRRLDVQGGGGGPARHARCAARRGGGRWPAGWVHGWLAGWARDLQRRRQPGSCPHAAPMARPAPLLHALQPRARYGCPRCTTAARCPRPPAAARCAAAAGAPRLGWCVHRRQARAAAGCWREQAHAPHRLAEPERALLLTSDQQAMRTCTPGPLTPTHTHTHTHTHTPPASS